MTTTLHDVALAAGVSIKTVSNVVNDTARVRPETRQRVLDAVAALDYRPNLSARSLRSGRTGMIDLLIPDLRNAYFAELADAVIRAAEPFGLGVLIQQFGLDREGELRALVGTRDRHVDGALYSVLGLDDADAGLLSETRIPLVLLGDRTLPGAVDHVTMQNVAAGRAATEHLLRLGRRRIAALGSEPSTAAGSGGLRLTGYAAALSEADVALDPALVLPAGAWHRRDGADATRTLLARGIPFDAVFAFNDTVALGAMRVLQESGRRVPDDVAIIGFDDIDETRYSLPTLSTVDPGREEIAQTAVRLLVDRIGGAPGGTASVEAAFSIVPRESTVGIR